MTAIENIMADMDWRMGELGSLKTIPHRYHMEEQHIAMLKRYIVPAIYGLWEGFVKNTILVYIEEINKAEVPVNSICLNTLIYMTDIDDNLKLSTERKHKEKKERFIKNFQNLLATPVNMKLKVITESNVNLEVANHLLESFNIETLPDVYEGKLNKLLNFRNAIAHGESAISVGEKEINEFSQLIVELMSEIAERVEKGLLSKSYLSN